MRSVWSLLVTGLMIFQVGQVAAQTRLITGRVTDSLTGEAVTSGQVMVEGTAITASVGGDGTFTVAAPARDVTLSVRSIGFKRGQVAMPASQNAATVALERDYFQLEAIVVTGQATGVERKNLANAVATVTAAELVKVPRASVEQSLQGKLVGAQILNNSGAPGGGLTVYLRGVTSIIGAYQPLYVVDGVVVSNAEISPGTNPVSRAAGAGLVANNQENPVNRIADLNPNDIENIEVLKGASASAIYGSKASNGVILITTKRGRVGAPQFTLTQRLGVSENSRKWGFRVFNDVAEATTVFAGAGNYFTAGQVFDHEEEIFHKPLSYETSLGLSGGTENTQYYVSGLVKRDAGIIRTTFYDKRSLRLNIDQSVGNRIRLGVSSEVINSGGNRGLTQNDNSGTSLYGILFTTPTFFDVRGSCGGAKTAALRCPDGSVPSFPVNPYSASNPLQNLALMKLNESLWRFIGAARLQVDAVNTSRHNVRLSANAGSDLLTQKNVVFSPPELQFEPVDGLAGTSALSFSQNLNLNVNGNAVYTFKTGGGTSATTSIGVQYETRDLDIDRTASQGLVGGLQVVQSGTAVQIGEQIERVEDFGYFAQEEFLTFGERLLLTAGGRMDKSSNNGDPDQWFVYPKAAASFRLPSLKRGLVDEFKIRGAFGESGNQPLFGQKYIQLGTGNVGGVPTFKILGTAGAPDIKPERQREIEAGVDATLFGSRASLEITAYEKKITDLLLQRTLAPSEGFSSQIFNAAAMRTRGLELGMSVLAIQRAGFQWTSRANFFLSRSKMTSLPIPAYVVGNINRGAIRIAPDSSPTQLTGYDSLPDGTRVTKIVGDKRPDYHIGWTNEFTAKSLRFYLLWDHQRGGWLQNVTLLFNDLAQNSVDYATPRKAGELTGKQRFAAFPRQSKVYLQSTTYLKLREVTLSYELPASVVQGFWSGARYVRLSLSGRDLLTFTPYVSGDPEEGEHRAAAAAPTRDLWVYPPSRSLWFSIDLGF
ncbi:MAG: SusC/RagA family TonB-linked outer membrane protein [Gemmatimonadetes bacterium]|nr:SusC/RagA family TonB-linked outer membrane protein [Gemmatimonadota bacterium]